jgi:putative effector of murein hydrolase
METEILVPSYAVVSTFLCFLLSVGAAALAINLYKLLRTGEIGASWRVLITASVLFSLIQAVKLAEVCGVPYAATMHLSSIIELVFVLALAYAFYLQRQVFTEARHALHKDLEAEDENDDEKAAVSVYEP